MRQRRWIELMADYCIDLQYSPSKINTVPDALSRKSENKVLVQLAQQVELLREIIKLDLQGTSETGQLMTFRFSQH